MPGKLHEHLKKLEAEAQKRQENFEKRRLSNDVQYQRWIMEACVRLRSLCADVEVPDDRVDEITRLVEEVGTVTWTAGREKVMIRIVDLVAGFDTATQ